ADRAARVSIAHQHGLDRSSVTGGKQRLDRPVARRALVLQLEAREWHGLAQPLTQRGGQVRHLLVAGGALRHPLPHLARAEWGLAARGERLIEELEIHGPYGCSRCV